MATYYLDYENGSDAYAGDSFAAGHPWKTITSGPTAARIAPGDIIKIAKSPAPVSLGCTGIWTNKSKTVTLGAAQNLNIDLCETAYTAITGLITVLNATPTAGGTGYTLNDILTITTGGTLATCQVTGVSAGVVTAVTLLTGGNGGYTTGTGKVTSGGTGSGCTVNITTVANATVTRTAVGTNGKEGSYSMKVAAPTTVKAGSKLAYLAISPGSLSGYQNMSLWLKNSAAISANQWKICLCSDAAGETIVDEFLVPAIASTTRWLPLNIVKTGGGNLGASIASIAIYSATSAPTSASNILFDDIIACTTSGLNLQSLISKNSAEQGGAEGWYGIQSINGVTVLLDNGPATLGNAGRGYSGVTETVTTYIRETIKTALATTLAGVVQAYQDAGTLASKIEYQGGYDTGTGLQTGETFFDGLNGWGWGLSIASGKEYNVTNLLNFCRYGTAFVLIANNNYITAINNSNNNTQSGIYLSGTGIVVGTLMNVNNNCSAAADAGIGIASCYGITIDHIGMADNCLGNGILLQTSMNAKIRLIDGTSNNSNGGVVFWVTSAGPSHNNIIDKLTSTDNGTYGIDFNIAQNNYIKDLTTSGNTTAAIYNNIGKNYIGKWTQSDTTPVTGYTSLADSAIMVSRFNNAYDKIFTDGGNIVSQASTLSNGSGKEWEFTTETNLNRDIRYPLTLTIARIAVTANNQVSVSCWFKKGHATNIGAKLICHGEQIAGVDNDVIATKADDTSEENLNILFTPTEDGVVEIEASAYYIAGHSTVIVDQMTITQA